MSKYLFFELFCGSARLCSAVLLEGIPSLGIDYLRNQSIPECFILHIDLSTDEGWKEVEVLSSEAIVFFFAPPCGTASRAREIPLSSELLSEGLRAPQPLRTEEFPDGICNLTGNDLLRLVSANNIYSRLGTFVSGLVARGKWFIIENPARSLFWMTSWIKPLF